MSKAKRDEQGNLLCRVKHCTSVRETARHCREHVEVGQGSGLMASFLAARAGSRNGPNWSDLRYWK